VEAADRSADIRVNTMAVQLEIDLRDYPPLVHFAERQDMVAWPMRRIASGG
jgi:hypothetical protein